LLIGQGEPDRKLYFVESGDLKVDMHTEGGIIHLAIVGSGSVALALAMALGTLLSARMMDLSKRVTVF
jgi:CRP-like cAMP-binding protein